MCFSMFKISNLDIDTIFQRLSCSKIAAHRFRWLIATVDQLEPKDQNQDSPHQNVNCRNTMHWIHRKSIETPINEAIPAIPAIPGVVPQPKQSSLPHHHHSPSIPADPGTSQDIECLDCHHPLSRSLLLQICLWFPCTNCEV
jgi:hypothetical protein